MSKAPRTSAKKAAANRRNSKKSTGPRTPEGKARSSLNALRHGLRAETLVLPDEDVEAFEHLRSRTWGELGPVGVLEEGLVERIVATLWRLRRVLRVEVGLFMDHHEREAPSAPARIVFGFGPPVEELDEEEEGLAKTLVERLQRIDPEGRRERLLALVDQDEEEIRETGAMVEELLAVEYQKRSLEDALHRRAGAGDFEAARGLREEAHQGARSDKLRAAMDNARDAIRDLREETAAGATASSGARMAARWAQASGGDPFSKLARYETSLERSLYRALQALHVLQEERQAKGKPGPSHRRGLPEILSASGWDLGLLDEEDLEILERLRDKAAREVVVVEAS